MRTKKQFFADVFFGVTAVAWALWFAWLHRPFMTVLALSLIALARAPWGRRK